MNTFIKVIYIIGTVVFLILWIRQLFLKANLHFKLLKELFPEKLKNIRSYNHYLMTFSFYKLDLQTFFWISSPLYYTRKKTEKLSDKAKDYHYKLKKISSRIILYFVLFILWLFLIGFILSRLS